MSAAEWIGSITGVLALVVTVALWSADRARSRRATMLAEVADVKARLIQVETQIRTQLEPLWKQVRFASVHAASALLHSPDNELGLDRYIEKFMQGDLGHDETLEFIRLLEGVRVSGPTESKRFAADVLLREIETRALATFDGVDARKTLTTPSSD